MAWDFFKQFHKFTDLSIGNLNPNAFALYIRLMVINDKAGRIEWFGTTNERLAIETGITIDSLSKARNNLIQMGFNEYKKGKSHSPSRYKLVPIDEDFLKESGKFSQYFSVKNLYPKKTDQKHG